MVNVPVWEPRWEPPGRTSLRESGLAWTTAREASEVTDCSERGLAACRTGRRFLDADPILDQDPGLIDGERLGPQVDIRPAQTEYFTATQAMKRQAPRDM